MSDSGVPEFSKALPEDKKLREIVLVSPHIHNCKACKVSLLFEEIVLILKLYFLHSS